MKPQQQHTCCLQACVASILELPLYDVPVVPDDDDWIAAMNVFLADYGTALIELDIHFEDGVWVFPDVFVILVGTTEDGMRHAVVGRSDSEAKKFEPVFNPSDAEVINWESVLVFLLVCDPKETRITLECRICSHRWAGTEVQNCECPNCGNMTGDAVDS